MRKNKRQEIILGRLLLGETVNTTKLAKQFGVSDRTILNDINELKLAHEIISPKKGFYKLKTIPNYMQKEQKEIIENLIFSLAISAFKDFKDEIRKLFIKEPIVDFDIEFEEIRNLDIFKQILQSIKWDYSVEFEYQGYKKIIHPLKVANYFFYWYLIGYDLKEEKVKSFLINKISKFNILYERLFEDDRIKRTLKKSPWIKEKEKSVMLKIYSPYCEAILRKVPVNCELLKEEKEYVLLKLNYYTDEEALNFIKRYLPSIKILDEILNKKLKKLLQDFLIRN